MASALKTLNIYSAFSPNMANAFMTFNLALGAVTYSVSAGTGTAVNTTAKYYKVDRSLLLTATDDTTDFIVNHSVDTRFTAPETRRHFIQFQLYNPNTGCDSGEIFALGISLNGASAVYHTVTAEDVGIFDTWVGFYVDMLLTATDTLDFTWKLKANATGTTHAVYFDGFKIESDNRINDIPSEYTLPLIAQQPDNLTLVTNIDFASTVAGAETTVDVGFTLAVPGQVVVLGFTIEAVAPMVSYYAYVTLPNVVTVVLQNNSAVTVNPTLATFTIKIIP